MSKNVARRSWQVGSFCEIYSISRQQWFTAEIVAIFTDEEGEWLQVNYNNFTKEIQRFSDRIRPLKSHHINDNVIRLKKKKRKSFKRLIASNDPSNYYHNTIVHILFMLPKIRETILSNDYSQNKAIHDLQKTFIKLNDLKVNNIKFGNLWELIGYPAPSDDASFEYVVQKLPIQTSRFCSLNLFPTRYMFINLGKCIISNNNRVYVNNAFKPQLIMDLMPFTSKQEIARKNVMKKVQKNINVLYDILYFWMDNNQNTIRRFRDCGKLIEQLTGYQDGKLNYELVAVVMASNLDRVSNRCFWSFIKDLKHECCGNTMKSNHWYLFKKETEIISVDEAIIENNLTAFDFTQGVAHLVVYRQLSILMD